jgi:hypothetical protein
MLRRLSGACLAVLLVSITSVPVFSKPPDLPQDAKIVVSPQTPSPKETLPAEPTVPESGEWRAFRESLQPSDREPDPYSAALREMLSSSLFLEVHPFVAFWGDAGRQSPVPCQAPAEMTSQCPYMRQKAQREPIRVLNPDALRSVMDNLRALEQAAKQMHRAQEFAAEGHFAEALKCLEKVRELCPGSSFERQIEEAYQEFISAADAQMKKPEAAEEEEPDGCCCGCCCGWLHQFGMCWISQFIDWCKEQSTKAAEPDLNQPIIKFLQNSEDTRQIQEEWGHIWILNVPPSPIPERIHGGLVPECEEQANKRGCGEAHCSPLSSQLENPVSLSFDGESLSKVLDEITFVHGMPFVIDRGAFQQAGLLPPDQLRIQIHVDQIPLKRALEVILGRYQLEAQANGCVMTVTTASLKSGSEFVKGTEEASEETSCPKMCGSVCPKCEALHAKYVKQAGVKEQVDGLMKACYLAVGDGRFEKAADLARQAYALDPTRVEGDPIVYKLHLLVEHEEPAVIKGCCPKSECPKCCPAEQQKPKCDDPGLSLCPELPSVSGDVPAALDEVLTGTDELAKKTSKEHAKKRCFTVGVTMECWGVSLEEVVGLMQGFFLPQPLTEKGLRLTLGTSGIGVQGTVPCPGANCTLFLRDGVFLMWMSPETTAK